ncbi:MAG TPA: FliM/FliN family flagellar motor switch protein [Polyangiaceae bacterium LLY-WYZ-14_1]|nr:FliM/FliN family flagellar motor switch protein [Polyangiaceae bacterium LLY-WYZ-14_1]
MQPMTHAEVALLRTHLRADAWGALPALLDEAEALLGVRPEVTAGPIVFWRPGASPPLGAFGQGAGDGQPSTTVLLGPPDGTTTVAIVLPPDLGAVLVHRLLGGDGDPGASGAGSISTALSAGAIAHAAGRLVLALRRTLGKPPLELRVVGVRRGPWEAAGDLMHPRDQPAALQTVEVRVTPGVAGPAWVWWHPARTTTTATGDDSRSRAVLERWRWAAELPVEVGLQLARATLPARAVRHLAPGDLLLPDSVDARVDALGALRGAVSLVACGGMGRLRCWVDEDGLKAVGGFAAAPGRSQGGKTMHDDPDRPWTGQPPGPDGPSATVSPRRGSEPSAPTGRIAGGPVTPATKGTSTASSPPAGSDDPAIPPRELLSTVAEAPVEVAIELARFRLPLGELLSARPGEVLASGVEVGSQVRLTIGDRLIATGELVDVEGELGVRLIRVAE